LLRFATPHAAKAHYENLDTLSADQMAAIRRDIAEANENLHTTIEESFQPYLENLRRGDLTFLSTEI
jgi:DNA phosphorothioation-dependent restriction protein DptG